MFFICEWIIWRKKSSEKYFSEFPLPKEVLPSHFFDGDDSFDEDDNAIIDAANEMEFNYKLDERESQNHNGSHNELNDMEDESLISAVDELEKSLQEANWIFSTCPWLNCTV